MEAVSVSVPRDRELREVPAAGHAICGAALAACRLLPADPAACRTGAWGGTR
jgi:hypothetical protein